ncbi:Reverse transcriptase domain [Cinara cedri]|uniref:Reverse transcriptase domain n=1 Tax=Cinara cedri TaxID=506608 RepID=A0A5E4NQR6_9HEMI|nr:Reverse transcriptase domain [Cinara cedri]
MLSSASGPVTPQSSKSIGNHFSSIFDIEAGVPQGSDLASDLFNIFTSDIPQTNDTILATYADDTAILSSNSDSAEASSLYNST